MMTDMFEDDEETEAFVAAARAALSLANPVPSTVSDLAKIAFQFRDVSTVRGVDATELAAVRAASTGAIMQATKDDVTLIWAAGNGMVTGVVHGAAPVAISLQTVQFTETLDVDSDNGSFEYTAPNEPHRLLVQGETVDWATSWST